MATTKKVTDWKMKSPPPSQIYLLTSLFQPDHLVPLWKPLAAEEVTQSDIPKMAAYFHHHMSAFTAQGQLKSPKFISGNI